MKNNACMVNLVLRNRMHRAECKINHKSLEGQMKSIVMHFMYGTLFFVESQCAWFSL